MIVGYARCSTTDQDVSTQIQLLEQAGCTKIFSELASATSVDGREELASALRYVREGDTLIVTRIDRLARSMRDFCRITTDLKERGVAFKCSEQPIDSSGAAGSLTMHILAAVAEFETLLRRERQLEGIAKAKAEGKYKGRRPSVDREGLRALLALGIGPAEIARELRCTESSVYRLRDELNMRPANSSPGTVEGLKKWRDEGGKRGPSIDRERCAKLLEAGVSAATIAKMLKCSQTSVYRVKYDLGDDPADNDASTEQQVDAA
jgi:DNA invertase Pin-like site-specific DNA recombinase